MHRVLGLEVAVQWEPREGKSRPVGSTRVAGEGRNEGGENEVGKEIEGGWERYTQMREK